jgi:ribosomal protein L16 Arg81 hydroxylase
MAINPFSFEELIFPIKPKVFFDEYWEKKFLLVNQRNGVGFKDFLTLKDVEHLLFSPPAYESTLPWVRFINNTKILNPQEYVSNKTGSLHKPKVIQGYNSGNTIAIIKLEERFEPLKKICIEFESVIGHPAVTEIFLTPPSSQGFKAHFDKFNVFVLQIEGKKHWKIYDMHVPYPLASNTNPYGERLPEPTCEFDLYPGDILYLPRGLVHEVSTTSDYSLHLTLGIDVFTWAHLLNEMIKNEPEFRKALPIQSLLSENAESIDAGCLEGLKQVIADQENIDLAFRKIKSKFSKIKNYSLDNDFSLEKISKHAITSETVFEKREGYLCALITEGEETTLYFGEEEIKGPSTIEPALQFILNTPRFSIKTMPALLDESGNTLLVRSLLKAGLIVVSAAD